MDHSTRSTLRVSASAAAAGLLLALTALAAQAQSPTTTPAPAATPSAVAAPAGWTKATTVFVNTVIGSRTGGSAKRLNESHAEMEAKGWRFMSLETYTENGDLVGFFVTYVK
jgi:hypothetical protein